MDEKTKLAAEIARDITVAALQTSNAQISYSTNVAKFFQAIFDAVHEKLSSGAET